MKKFVLSFVLAFVAVTLSAQETPIYLQQGTQSISGFISFSANSLIQQSTGILYNYYLKDDLALRANVRLGYNNVTSEYSNGDTKVERTDVDNEFRLGAGIQKSLIKSRRFNGYVAADALMGVLGQKDIYGERTDKTTAFEIGIRPAMGIEFHFVDKFFVGLEWGYDVLFNNQKFDERSSVRNTVLDVADLSSACFRVGFNF